MVTPSVYLLVVATVIATAVFLLFIRPAQRRRRLTREPLPVQWQSWIEAAVPFYALLPQEQKHQLEQRLKLFVAEKTFYGCDGLEIEDRHRVTIAAQACLLLLARTIDEFSAIQAILLYPSAYRVPSHANLPAGSLEMEEAGVVSDEDVINLGEFWGQGRVILSWADIESEINGRHAGGPIGASVVIHEFAHQLDETEGLSIALESGSNAPARTLARAYQALRHTVEAGHEPFIDPYGATSPQEFIAVATETFFQDPAGLYESDQELYKVLSRLYHIDLARLLRLQHAAERR